MPLTGDRSRNYPVAIVALAGPLFGGLYALWLGQDVNPDQRNYHFESAHAFLAGRIDIDAAPSDLIHSYFNPLPYLPFYEMARHWRPSAQIFATGAWQGVAISLALALSWRFAPRAPGRFALAALATIVSAAAPLALSELGSSFADLSLAPLILVAALALTAGADAPRLPRALVLTGLAAFAVGLAVGLKLTHAIYAFGIAAACGIGWKSWGQRVGAWLVSAASGVLGVAASGGFWFWMLWSRFRSPVFPYYDHLFLSPEIDPASPMHGVSFFDPHFIFKSVNYALYLPFRWIAAGYSTAELQFRDIRFALLAAALAGALAMRIAGRAKFDPAGQRLIAFFLASFAAWAYAFPIQRYLISLELLLGPVLLVALAGFFGQRALLTAFAGFAVAAVATVKTPDWGHVPAGADWYEMQLPEPLTAPALVFTQAYTSYIAPFLPPESVVVGLGPGTFLRKGAGNFNDRVASAALARDPSPPVFALTDGLIRPQARASLGSYGLDFSGPCLPVRNSAGFIAACPLAPGGHSPRAARLLRAGETIRFGASADGLSALLSGWDAESGEGRVGPDQQPRLWLRWDASLAGAPIKLTFTLARFDEAGDGGALTLSADGKPLAEWTKAEGANLVACLLASQATELAFGYRGATPGAVTALRLDSLRVDRGGCNPAPY